jgi:hypothetical protein
MAAGTGLAVGALAGPRSHEVNFPSSSEVRWLQWIHHCAANLTRFDTKRRGTNSRLAEGAKEDPDRVQTDDALRFLTKA